MNSKKRESAVKKVKKYEKKDASKCALLKIKY